MTPHDSGYNPFNSPDFRKEMSDMFDDKLGDMPKLVAEHEEYIQQQRGGGRILHYVWTGLLGIVAGWFGGKTH